MSVEARVPFSSDPAGAGPRDALSLHNVDISYRVHRRDQRVVRDVSFRVAAGESFGLVGESGCGKSTIALAIVRYLARNGRVSNGTIEIGGADVLSLDKVQLRRLRARTVSMVYQEPGRALNPSILVGRQVAEVYEIAGADRRTALQRAEEILTRVRISDPRRVMDRYPHQLSGGMLQRVVVAMALAAEPALLILDEPTTALDATVEAEVLDLVKGLRSEFNTSLLFISHNLAVVAKMCDRVGVLYAGELIEEGPAREVFAEPRHPYTIGLVRSIPRREAAVSAGAPAARAPLATIPGALPEPGSVLQGCIFADRCGLAGERCRTEIPPVYPVGENRGSRCHYHERASTLSLGTTAQLASAAAAARGGETREREPLLRVRAAGKTFHMAGQSIRGLWGVDLDIAAGETVGLVGESGSGKTTLARVIMGLTAPDEGTSLQLDGTELAPRAGARSARDQKALQIVFQNPDSALNRRHSVRRLISRSLSKLGGYAGQEREARLLALMRSVRLPERYLPMRPAQLSGGLKQRVAIARAFAGDPRLVVCDEPTSALDVSVQAAILNLLTDLQHREDVAYLFISHDLGVVRYLADRIVVLYLGRVMEVGPADAVFAGPHHPYTEALL
ncbi:MAG TPA: ABC transporter ATP-binding protein, partial [Solirubrobacteraceae bacterium]|nr:ABC transporter ATP-binding protein [Solirubrobacteraceae bacterium]